MKDAPDAAASSNDRHYTSTTAMMAAPTSAITTRVSAERVVSVHFAEDQVYLCADGKGSAKRCVVEAGKGEKERKEDGRRNLIIERERDRVVERCVTVTSESFRALKQYWLV